MELIRGTTLRERLQLQGPLSVSELVRLALEMLEALEHIHERGVVHRDVKPDNVMLVTDLGAKLMDFGVAQVTADGSPVPSGGFQGSPAYMSPEQVSGRAVDRRTDIYSLAVTLYEAATGRRAVSGETISEIAQQVTSELPPPPAGVPPWLQSILLRALAKEPNERYARAADMAVAIRAGEAGQLAVVVRPSRSARGAAPAGARQAGAGPAQRAGFFAPAEPPAAPSAPWAGTESPGAAAPASQPPTAPLPALTDFAGDMGPLPPQNPCAVHSAAEAVAVCGHCFLPICPTCLLEVIGRGVLCRACAYSGR
jgi:serine/threonine-protein kinase